MVPSSLPILLVVIATGAAPQAIPPGPALVLESDSECPSAQAVRAALVGLRSVESVDDWPPAKVAIFATEQFLRVELGGSRTRQLAVGTGCTTRAATVALIVATWLGEFPVDVANSPILRPLPQPTPQAVSQPLSLPRPPSQQEIGAALLTTLNGGMAPGVRLEYARLRRAGRLGWQASLAWPAPREVAVAGGKTLFTRVAASVAVRGGLPLRRFWLSGDAGVAAAYTRAWGSGYDTNQGDQSLTYGVTAGLRGGLPWRRFRIWTGVRIFRWLYGQSVQVDSDDAGSSTIASLPMWDVQWALGASYVF